MKCLQATKVISLSQEQRLSLRQEVELYAHLLMCRRCRQFKKNCEQLNLITKAFRANK